MSGRRGSKLTRKWSESDSRKKFETRDENFILQSNILTAVWAWADFKNGGVCEKISPKMYTNRYIWVKINEIP
jgi:hypothetical protein